MDDVGEGFWTEFNDMIESFRVMVARPELWEQDFTVSLVGILEPEERLAIKSEADRLVWAGGDATLEIFAFIDWTLRTYFLLQVAPFFLALKAMMNTDDDKLIIAVSELLVIVLGAIVSGEGWRGRLVFYVGDNQNVIT
jgi:hypothetical protein